MPINISTFPAIFPWRPATWLEVRGADAASFLQGQFTNDLRILDREPAVYGLWLNVKGKVLADGFVLRRSDAEGFWVGSYFSSAATVKDRLESFIIADDVEVRDVTAEWRGVTVFGVDEAFVRNAREHALVFPGRRSRAPHFEVVYPAGVASVVEPLLQGCASLGSAALTRERIEAGVPAVPADVGPGDLPNEAGLDDVAVSYTKGCYLGQEVMARLKSMGQVRRRLLPVRGAGGLPGAPAPLFHGVKQAGELRSVVALPEGGFIGFAMVSLLNAEGAEALSLSAGGPADIRLSR